MRRAVAERLGSGPVTPRARLFAVIAFGLLTASAAQCVALAPREAALDEATMAYECDAGMELSFDAPYVRLTTSAPATDATIVLRQDGELFEVHVGELEPDSVFEIDLESFLGSDGSPADPSRAPESVAVVSSSGRHRLCGCEESGERPEAESEP